jgi:hypothetical protein
MVCCDKMPVLFVHGTFLEGFEESTNKNYPDSKMATVFHLSQFVIYQLIHKTIALKRTLKFILKQLLQVSVQSPSRGSALVELAKVIAV